MLFGGPLYQIELLIFGARVMGVLKRQRVRVTTFVRETGANCEST